MDPMQGIPPIPSPSIEKRRQRGCWAGLGRLDLGFFFTQHVEALQGSPLNAMGKVILPGAEFLSLLEDFQSPPWFGPSHEIYDIICAGLEVFLAQSGSTLGKVVVVVVPSPRSSAYRERS